MNQIILPYPPSILNPNRKAHWAIKAKAKKKYKADCYNLAKTIKPCAEFSLEFLPPDSRKRDLDNAIAAFKAGQDGLADAWGINDKDFIIHYPKILGEPVKHGAVILTRIDGGES